jgi:predicted SnoaL-like aldol condensation-catalyzing enzyme
MFQRLPTHEAVARYVDDDYIGHNPHVESGKGGFVAYFERMAREFPGKHVEIKRAIAEGDLVVVRCRQDWPGCSNNVAVDIFRFDDGRKIARYDLHHNNARNSPTGDRLRTQKENRFCLA